MISETRSYSILNFNCKEGITEWLGPVEAKSMQEAIGMILDANGSNYRRCSIEIVRDNRTDVLFEVNS